MAKKGNPLGRPSQAMVDAVNALFDGDEAKADKIIQESGEDKAKLKKFFAQRQESGKGKYTDDGGGSRGSDNFSIHGRTSIGKLLRMEAAIQKALEAKPADEVNKARKALEKVEKLRAELEEAERLIA